MDQLDISKLNDNVVTKIIKLGFSYYDLSNDTYEDDVQDLLETISTDIKPIEVKQILRYIIELINSEGDNNSIKESLETIKMPDSLIRKFIEIRNTNLSQIENMNLALTSKKNKSRIENFHHSFFIKYVDSLSDKVEFKVKIYIRYREDNGVSKDLEFETSISQFYLLLNDFSKIDTIISTLIN